MRYAGGCVWKVFPNLDDHRFAHAPASLPLVFPELTVVQVLFKDSSVVLLLLLLTLTKLFSP